MLNGIARIAGKLARRFSGKLVVEACDEIAAGKWVWRGDSAEGPPGRLTMAYYPSERLFVWACG